MGLIAAESEARAGSTSYNMTLMSKEAWEYRMVNEQGDMTPEEVASQQSTLEVEGWELVHDLGFEGSNADAVVRYRRRLQAAPRG